MLNVEHWLQEKTGKDNAYWMARIQSLIAEHASKSDNPDHDNVDTLAVLNELVSEIVRTAPVPGPGIDQYDSNLYAFSVLAQISALWYSRVHQAKIADPNRPVGNGMHVYKNRYLPWHLSMQMILFDYSKDSTYFPAQKWQNPFTPDADSGTFI